MFRIFSMRMMYLVFLMALTINQCGGGSEKNCKEDAKVYFRDRCLLNQLVLPIINPDEPQNDAIIISCLQYSYEYTQCSKKRQNYHPSDIFK